MNTLEHSISSSPDKKKDAFLRFQFLILWLGELIAICWQFPCFKDRSLLNLTSCYQLLIQLIKISVGIAKDQ